MIDGDDIPLPSVPDNESVRAYISTPDPSRVVPDITELFTGPDEISPESLLFGPGTVPASVASYAVAGDRGVGGVAQEVRDWATGLPSGKISKYDAYYFPETPLPYGVWEYRCRTCRFYVEADDSDDGEPKCEVVGQAGDLFGGEDIHPSAWCALWLPVDGRGWFEFVTERLESSSGGD